jgi:hypothetical protein
MRALVATLCLAAAPALADVAGPEAVFDGGWDCRTQENGIPGWLDCLRDKGASEAAVAFAARIVMPRPPEGEGYGLPGVLVAFTEQGAVDTGNVVFPELANSNEKMLFLNGDPAILHPYDILADTQPEDAASAAIRAAYPDVMSMGQSGIGPHRRLPDGTQRFVVTDLLVDGCRACDILGIIVAQIDFQGGRVAGSRMLGWMADDPIATDMRDRLIAGDTATWQLGLNLAGYGAGAMDGKMGPATRAALAAFRADHCTPAEGEAEADALIAAAEGAPAPCAP